MTRERDIDELITTFMQEGPAELSPRLLAGIRNDVHGTNQRTLWRPWRTPSMPRSILLVAVLGALLVAFGAMSLLGIGGRPVSTTPSPSPTPTVSPSAAASGAYPIADGEAWILVGAEEGAVLIKPDGTGRHTILTDVGVNVFDPRWSNDGRQVVFEGNGNRGSQVWVANADGTGARALTPTPAGCPDGICTEGVDPSWSPDGRSVAYIAVTHDAGVFSEAALAVLDVASGTTTELYSTTEASLARPSWSPDSGSIAVEVDRFERTPEISNLVSTRIAVVDVAGTDHTPRELTEAGDLAGFPSWHPTSDLIVFRTNRFDPETSKMLDQDQPSDLYTIHGDGSGKTQVTDNGVGGPIVRAPTWTSDGRILFSKLFNPTAQEELMLIDATGANEERATGDIVRTIGEGQWRPGT